MKKKDLLARIEFLENAVGELMVQLAELRGSIAAVPFMPTQPVPQFHPFQQQPTLKGECGATYFGHQSLN